MPEYVWEQVELETLVLAENELWEVPTGSAVSNGFARSISGITGLRRFPDALGDLEFLNDFLYLHDNRLTSLPSALSKLTRL